MLLLPVSGHDIGPRVPLEVEYCTRITYNASDKWFDNVILHDDCYVILRE